MNRPTFVTMSTLAFTIVAYFALTQTALADGLSAHDLGGSAPHVVGTGAHALTLSSAHTGASVRR